MRDLVFQPIDGELERHRAIGFAIGTLVARKVALPPPPPPVVVEQPPPLPPPAVAARAPVAVKDAPADDKGRGARGTWFDVQGGLGLGLIPGPPRVGALLRGAFEFSPGGFFAVAETGYAARPADASLRTRWWSLALGVGHPLLPRARSLGFDVRLLATVERLSLTATEGLRSGQEARFKPGGTIAVDARWDFLPALGCVLSVATFIDPERSVVRVGGEQVGETPAVGLNGFFGLRLRLR